MSSPSTKAFVALAAMIGVLGSGEGGSAESIHEKRGCQQKCPQGLLGAAYRFSENDFPKDVEKS